MDFLFTYQWRFARWLVAMMLICAGLAFTGFSGPAFAATQSQFPAQDAPYFCLQSMGMSPGACSDGTDALDAGRQSLVVQGAVFEEFLDGEKLAPTWQTITAPVSQVPLPMAGWLLVSALGGLGFFGRRRRDAFPSLRNGAEFEPLQSALRGSTGHGAPEMPVVRQVRPVELLRRLFPGMVRAGGPCVSAFSPECAGTVRSGGAENRYAIAEDRAPPAGRSCDLVGPVFSAGPSRVPRNPFDSCRSVATGLQLFFNGAPTGSIGGYSASNIKNGNTRITPRAGLRKNLPALHYQPTNNQEITL